MLRILGSPKRLCNGVIRRELLTSLIVFAALRADLAVADDQSPSSQPITIDNPQLLAADNVPAIRTLLGLANDYKPWIVQLKSGQLLIVAFCYGGTPSNELPKGEPYLERAIFWRSQNGGQTWGKGEERSDIHGREFALT